MFDSIFLFQQQNVDFFDFLSARYIFHSPSWFVNSNSYFSKENMSLVAAIWVKQTQIF